MLIVLGLTYFVLVGSTLATPDRGPVVRLDDAVGYCPLRFLFGGY